MAPVGNKGYIHSAGGHQGVISKRVVSPKSPKLIIPNRSSSNISSIRHYPDIVCQGQSKPPAHLVERFGAVNSNLFLNRIVRLGGAVEDEISNLLVAQLLYLDSVDQQKDITMYINSPGGSVTAGMAIFDTMQHIRPNVSTICVGMAASMGAFLLCAGAQGKRFGLPNCRIMIHQPLGNVQGLAEDVEIQANEILHHKMTLNGYIAEFTGQPILQVDMDTDKDFFMSSYEALEYGIIDAIISKPTLQSANQPPIQIEQTGAKWGVQTVLTIEEAAAQREAREQEQRELEEQRVRILKGDLNLVEEQQKEFEDARRDARERQKKMMQEKRKEIAAAEKKWMQIREQEQKEKEERKARRLEEKQRAAFEAAKKREEEGGEQGVE